jgi:hypothetical protein
MLFMEVIIIYCENDTKNINALCAQNSYIMVTILARVPLVTVGRIFTRQTLITGIYN